MFSSKHRRRGMVIVLTTVILFVLLAFTALTIDVGVMYNTRAELQHAADAAALAAVAALPDESEVLRTARKYAEINHRNHGNILLDSDIRVGHWDAAAGTFTVAELPLNAVRVNVQRSEANDNPLPLFFAGIFGRTTVNVSASATATAEFSSPGGCIVGLQWAKLTGSAYTDSYDSTEGPYVAVQAGNDGHVSSNGPITLSGSTVVHGDASPAIGYSVTTTGSSDVTGSMAPLQAPLDYPPVNPGDAATDNDNDRIPMSADGKNPLNSFQDFTLSGGDSVTLPPGTYYFRKIALSGGSTMNLVGPTVIYATGQVAVSGGSIANLTQLPSNLKLFPMGNQCHISASSEFYGLIYGPTTKFTRSGSSAMYGMVVGLNVDMSGSGPIRCDQGLEASPGDSIPMQVQLVE